MVSSCSGPESESELTPELESDADKDSFVNRLNLLRLPCRRSSAIMVLLLGTSTFSELSFSESELIPDLESDEDMDSLVNRLNLLRLPCWRSSAIVVLLLGTSTFSELSFSDSESELLPDLESEEDMDSLVNRLNLLRLTCWRSLAIVVLLLGTSTLSELSFSDSESELLPELESEEDMDSLVNRLNLLRLPC